MNMSKKFIMAATLAFLAAGVVNAAAPNYETGKVLVQNGVEYKIYNAYEACAALFGQHVEPKAVKSQLLNVISVDGSKIQLNVWVDTAPSAEGYICTEKAGRQ